MNQSPGRMNIEEPDEITNEGKKEQVRKKKQDGMEEEQKQDMVKKEQKRDHGERRRKTLGQENSHRLPGKDHLNVREYDPQTQKHVLKPKRHESPPPPFAFGNSNKVKETLDQMHKVVIACIKHYIEKNTKGRKGNQVEGPTLFDIYALKGGWEVWSQVELCLLLKEKMLEQFGSEWRVGVFRELPIYDVDPPTKKRKPRIDSDDPNAEPKAKSGGKKGDEGSGAPWTDLLIRLGHPTTSHYTANLSIKLKCQSSRNRKTFGDAVLQDFQKVSGQRIDHRVLPCRALNIFAAVRENGDSKDLLLETLDGRHHLKGDTKFSVQAIFKKKGKWQKMNGRKEISQAGSMTFYGGFCDILASTERGDYKTDVLTTELGDLNFHLEDLRTEKTTRKSTGKTVLKKGPKNSKNSFQTSTVSNQQKGDSIEEEFGN